MKINKGKDADIIKSLVISNGIDDSIVLIDGIGMEIKITTDGESYDEIIEGVFYYVDEETVGIIDYEEDIRIDCIEEIEVLSGEWF